MKLAFGLTSPLWAALSCIAISTAQAGVQEQGKEIVGKVRVPYADLDLTQQDDVRVLLTRLEKAAYRACGGNPRHYWTYATMPDRTIEAFKECREDAIARAISDIDEPTMWQAHAALRVARACEATPGC